MEKIRIRKSNEMHEVVLTYRRPLLKSMPKISSSHDAERIFRKIFDLQQIDYKETFIALLLTNGNSVLCYSQIGLGGATGVAIDIKEIVLLALKAHAAGIIIGHNHPSGTLKPSKKDLELTNCLNSITAFHSINLLDHLIVTSEGYYSLSDHGDILTPDNTLPF